MYSDDKIMWFTFSFKGILLVFNFILNTTLASLLFALYIRISSQANLKNKYMDLYLLSLMRPHSIHPREWKVGIGNDVTTEFDSFQVEVRKPVRARLSIDSNTS